MDGAFLFSLGMRISALQYDIQWENNEANYRLVEELLQQVENPDLIILPEMFNTGFSMEASKLAETMEGPSVKKLESWANQTDAKVMASLIIEEDGNYYNRIVCTSPGGQIFTYDKRHLFAFGGESRPYTQGFDLSLLSVAEMNCLPLICYDLRFPSWARYRQDLNYDVIIYVASWPQRRIYAWNTLLKARAIENQCYVIGVNRIGMDDSDVHYPGDTQVVDYTGQVLKSINEAGVLNYELDKDKLDDFRKAYPFLDDRDIM